MKSKSEKYAECMAEVNREFFFKKHLNAEDIADTIDGLGDDYEGKQIANYFEGKSNSDINLRSLLEDCNFDHKSWLAFMKPAAAAYFLGAYLSISLMESTSAGEVRSYLMAILSGYGFGPRETAWLNEMLSNLSVKKRQVVLSVAEFICNEFPDELLDQDLECVRRNINP